MQGAVPHVPAPSPNPAQKLTHSACLSSQHGVGPVQSKVAPVSQAVCPSPQVHAMRAPSMPQRGNVVVVVVVLVVVLVVIAPQSALSPQPLGGQTRQQPFIGSQRCPEGHWASAVQPVSTQAPAVCAQKAPPSVALLHVQPNPTQVVPWQPVRAPHSVGSHSEIVVVVVVVVGVVVVVLSQTVPAPHTSEQQSKFPRQPWSPSGIQPTHIPVVVSHSDMAQVPQLPPQPLSPQFLPPLQSGLQPH